MSRPDARWFWADAALEWLEALEDAADPAAVARTLEHVSASSRSRPLPAGLTEAAHMAAELVAAQRGAPALHLPRPAWRWLERHGDALDRGALSSAQRAVRRLIAASEADSTADADDGVSSSRAALLNLERRLRAADRRGAIAEPEQVAPPARQAPHAEVTKVDAPADLLVHHPVPPEQGQLAFVWDEGEPARGEGGDGITQPSVTDAPERGSTRGRSRRKQREAGATQPRLVPDERVEASAT